MGTLEWRMNWTMVKISNSLQTPALWKPAIAAIVFLHLVGIWHDKIIGSAAWALDKVLEANAELYFDLVAMGVGICH